MSIICSYIYLYLGLINNFQPRFIVNKNDISLNYDTYIHTYSQLINGKLISTFVCIIEFTPKVNGYEKKLKMVLNIFGITEKRSLDENKFSIKISCDQKVVFKYQ